MADCIFCQIVEGKVPCFKIYEDEEFLAFLDIFPQAEGHGLVIPKKHVEWVWDYPEIGDYFEVVGKVARRLREVSGEKVVRSLVLGWDVPHAHVHLVPGQKNTLGEKKLDEQKMKELAEKFKLEE